ncbi:MAG: hypothetical protein H6625_04850 [Bdellovibrionaceae bacterium]|nr:hypothetical protein [Pseudobdellovibrionaceae bacterium]
MMKKHMSLLKALLIVSAIVPLYQNCGRLKSSGTNGTFGSVGARNIDFDYKVFDPSYDEITDANPIFDVGQKYIFRINLEKLNGALIFWDLVYLGASCDLKVFNEKDSAEMECYSNGQIGVSVTAVYPDGNEKYGEIIGYVNDMGTSGPGSNIAPITVTITTAGNSQNWNIENAPVGHNSVNVVTGSGIARNVVVYLKQPIRIVNMDTAEHKPGSATAGIPCKSAPFPLKTEQSFTCITNTALADFDKYIIDELDNMAGGRFNFQVVDSKAVWQKNNCTTCHAMKTGNDPNDILNKLNTSIINVPGMQTYSSMTIEDRRALAFYMYYTP